MKNNAMEIKASNVHLSKTVSTKEEELRKLGDVLILERREKETQGKAITSKNKEILSLKEKLDTLVDGKE